MSVALHAIYLPVWRKLFGTATTFYNCNLSLAIIRIPGHTQSSGIPQNEEKWREQDEKMFRPEQTNND